MPTLKISCKAARDLDYRELQDFQGDLKDLTTNNYIKLRAQLETAGYAFAAAVWCDQDGRYWLLDGHQRLRVIRSMAEDGWAIPPLPVSIVEASSKEEAEARLMAGVSVFGTITNQGLYEFLETRKLDIDEILKANDLPDFDAIRFKADYYDDIAPKEPKPEVIERCPTCGKKKRPPKNR